MDMARRLKTRYYKRYRKSARLWVARSKYGKYDLRYWFLILWVALFGACAPTLTQIPITNQRAHYRIEEMRHIVPKGIFGTPFVETIRMVTVVNPWKEPVVFVCDDDFRSIIPAGTESTFRLDDRDEHCDLQNDTLYSPNTGVQ